MRIGGGDYANNYYQQFKKQDDENQRTAGQNQPQNLSHQGQSTQALRASEVKESTQGRRPDEQRPEATSDVIPLLMQMMQKMMGGQGPTDQQQAAAGGSGGAGAMSGIQGAQHPSAATGVNAMQPGGIMDPMKVGQRLNFVG